MPCAICIKALQDHQCRTLVHLEEVRILEPVLNAISQTNLAYSTPSQILAKTMKQICQQTLCYLTAFLTSRIQQEQVQRQNQVYHL